METRLAERMDTTVSETFVPETSHIRLSHPVSHTRTFSMESARLMTYL